MVLSKAVLPTKKTRPNQAKPLKTKKTITF